MMHPRDDRRDSPRVLTRLYVRGMGEEREWTDRLGDLGLGGVGFEALHRPEAQRYQVRFAVPGELRLRTALAEVKSAVPLPGADPEAGPYFVHLAFVDPLFSDQLDLARAFDRMEASAERALQASIVGLSETARALDFDIEEAIHSMLPVNQETPGDGVHTDAPPHMSSLPERLSRGEGGLGRYVFGAIARDPRALSSRSSA